MRIWLLGLVSISVLLAGACIKGEPYYKDAQANATPEQTPTPKPDDSKPFRDAAAALTKVPGSVKLSGDGYIKGKTALFYQSITLADKNKKDQSTTWTWNDSSPYPRADMPEEVQTVILRKCVEESMGTFVQSSGVVNGTEKIPAIGWKCDVTVIDKSIPAVVGRKTFESEIKERELVSEGSKELRRSPPLVEIDKYLKALPRQ